jgi:hypothetical protein
MFHVADAQKLYSFLESKEGKNFIEELRTRKPDVVKINRETSDIGTIEQIAVKGAYAQCWDDVITEIRNMAAERNEKSDGLDG